MRILVLRHGHAVDPYRALVDEQRWLTEIGRARVRRVAESLVGGGEVFRPTAIFTSPLVRAVQTAELFASVANPELERLEVIPALAPERGTTAEALSVLEELSPDDQIVLVSHEPKVRVLAAHLGRLAQMPAFSPASGTLIDLSGERPAVHLIESSTLIRHPLSPA